MALRDSPSAHDRPGADYHHSPGITAVDPSRLQAVLLNPWYENALKEAAFTCRLDDVDRVQELELVDVPRESRSMAWRVDHEDAGVDQCPGKQGSLRTDSFFSALPTFVQTPAHARQQECHAALPGD